ncbi:MAG: three-Cys-motif partner protein TcmP [Olsenella uli]|uniref:three-Cys-motif partner protein TcmP n=1 Tax=Olsenella uli TaxID=133926 RepID=UPI001D3B8EAA|nr:three-Cys-motif partner protein TcmP [Olsenella uli]MBS6418843.1 three-Cys-motif partner protein TcmP [Olsenella uli]
MGSTKDWDSGKKPWSATKDYLLSYYLSVFFPKVMSVRGRRILYIDGFAGPGEYGDGTHGSPITAIEKAGLAFRNARHKQGVSFLFSEASSKRRGTLVECVGSNSFMKSLRFPYEVSGEGFSSCVSKVLSKGRNFGTYFFYVDPFGVSDLEYQAFKEISRLNGIGNCGVEVLLNLSTVGFLREALCVMHMEDAIPDEATDGPDENFDVNSGADYRKERLTTIFGDSGWTDIVSRVCKSDGSFWRAEREIAESFCRRLRSEDSFRYVTSIPIVDQSKSVRNGGLLKYRMVHMTNHWQGCLTMNDTMVKAIESERPPSLFTVDGNGRYVSDDEMSAAFRDVIRSMRPGHPAPIGEIVGSVICEMGITLRRSEMCERYLAPLLDDGMLERVEKLTPTGRPKTSLSPKLKVIKMR